MIGHILKKKFCCERDATIELNSRSMCVVCVRRLNRWLAGLQS